MGLIEFIIDGVIHSTHVGPPDANSFAMSLNDLSNPSIYYLGLSFNYERVYEQKKRESTPPNKPKIDVNTETTNSEKNIRESYSNNDKNSF